MHELAKEHEEKKKTRNNLLRTFLVSLGFRTRYCERNAIAGIWKALKSRQWRRRNRQRIKEKRRQVEILARAMESRRRQQANKFVFFFREFFVVPVLSFKHFSSTRRRRCYLLMKWRRRITRCFHRSPFLALHLYDSIFDSFAFAFYSLVVQFGVVSFQHVSCLLLFTSWRYNADATMTNTRNSVRFYSDNT